MTPKSPPSTVIDNLLTRYSAEALLRGIADGVRRQARVYGSETVSRFEHEQAADSIAELASVLPNRFRRQP